LYKKLRN